MTTLDQHTTLKAYGPAFATAALAITQYSAEATAFELIGVTLGLASVPVLLVGVGVAVFASGTLQDQANNIPSTLAPLASPFMFVTVPLSPLVSPTNDPLLLSKVLTPILEVGTGLAKGDEGQIPSSLLQAHGWQEDTAEYYEKYLRPEIAHIAQSVSDFMKTLGGSDDSDDGSTD